MTTVVREISIVECKTKERSADSPDSDQEGSDRLEPVGEPPEISRAARETR